jgi:uncharacterized membrane protein YdjX (TVP38/TMEM64 family)
MAQTPGPVPPTPQSPPTKARHLWRQLGPTGGLIVLALVLPTIGLLFAHPLLHWADWLRAHEPRSLFYYAGFVALVGGLALLPTWVLSALAGFTFGFARGSIATMAGLTIGAVLMHAIALLVARDRITSLIQGKPAWNRIHRALIGSGFWRTTAVIALVRIPPIMSFAFTNVALASMRVRRGAFTLGTILGLAPRTLITVYAGATARKLDLERTLDLAHTRVWRHVLEVVLSLVALAVLSYLAHRTLHRMTAPQEPSQAGPK